MKSPSSSTAIPITEAVGYTAECSVCQQEPHDPTLRIGLSPDGVGFPLYFSSRSRLPTLRETSLALAGTLAQSSFLSSLRVHGSLLSFAFFFLELPLSPSPLSLHVFLDSFSQVLARFAALPPDSRPLALVFLLPLAAAALAGAGSSSSSSSGLYTWSRAHSRQLLPQVM